VPGIPPENYSLEHMTIKELEEKLPKIIASAKKRSEHSPVEAKDIFMHKVFVNDMELIPSSPVGPEEILKDSYGKEV